jgi:FAD/FMN-containing dehydrogenase
MGAAIPSEGCIVLSLRRMDSVLGISKEDMSARMQPGVILEDAAAALEENGLVLGHDPWSLPIATVGGAISTDGVGYLAAKYGSMGEQVLGLEVVLADGEVIRTRAVPKSSSGPSLDHLFIGSEGTFGVITEATLRAFPRPESRILRAMVFPDFESGFGAIAELYVEDVRPAMVDFDQDLPEGSASNSSEATLRLSFEGFKEEVQAQELRAREICLRFGGRDGDPAEAQRFWSTRHASGERYRREVLENRDPGGARRAHSAYGMEYLHVALPASRVLEYRRRCQRVLESHHIKLLEWSLWARPEFFSFLIVEEDGQEQETSLEMADAVDEVLNLAQEMGGAMEYCHGVGLKLAHLMGSEMGAGWAVLRKLKKAIDPHNILNPGKLMG